jgi:undecaprenyl-diphosphatase
MIKGNTAPRLTPPLFIFLTIETMLVGGMILIYKLPQLNFIAAWQNPEDKLMVALFQFISDSINYFSMGIPLLIAITYEWMKRDVRSSRFSLLYLLISIGIAGLISYALKKSFLEPRPYEVDSRIMQLSVGGGYSFPSGHTTEAFASATAIFLLFFNRKKFCWIGFIWAGTVGASRVYLGVHYPFDVLAGMIIGTSVSYLVYQFVFFRWINGEKITSG